MRSSPAVSLLVLSLAAGALAGCLGGGDDGAPGSTPVPEPEFLVDWAAHALPFGGGHDHRNAAHHQNLSTPNFELLGWDPLVSAHYGYTAGTHACGDVAQRADGLRLAVVHSFSTDVAFVLADVTDPRAPKMVGEYVLTNTDVYDVALTADGLHVVVGTTPGGEGETQSNEKATALALPEAPDTRPVQLRFRDACTGETRASGPEQELPLQGSVMLIGVADPANPVFEDYVPLPLLGAHSVSTAGIDGTQYVLASVTNLEHQASYYHFYTVGSTPLGPNLQQQSVFQAPASGPTSGQPLVNGHVDGTIQKHPLTSQVLAYLADWDAGVVIVDVSNPRTPRQIGQWTDYEGAQPPSGPPSGIYDLISPDIGGSIHEAVPIDGLWDGKHYVIAGQEIVGHPKDQPSGRVNILDTTDPAQPTFVGRWTLPVDVVWEEALQFSTHYVEIVNRTLFVTTYHGGVWAIDLSTNESLLDPPTIGVFTPANESPEPPRNPAFRWTPTVLDAVAFADGDLAVWDSGSGVYMVRFDAGRPAPAPPTWYSQDH